MQPLKWHGGKGAFNGKLAKWIISLMPPHTHYVEPYFGGGSVLLRKNPEGVSEVVSDLHGELSNFWAVLRDKGYYKELVRLCEATPFSEALFHAPNVLSVAGYPIPVKKAWKFFVRCRMSRQGMMKDFATTSRTRTRRGMNEQVSSWLTAVEGLPEVHERLRRVLIRCSPALDTILIEDGPQTCFYLDPPYLQEVRTAKKIYQHEMTTEEHKTLLETLTDIEGKFLLSGYQSELYDSFSRNNNWNRHEFRISNNASASKKKRTMTECIWTNF